MNNDIRVVKDHFSNDMYIQEMFDRNTLGLRDWENVIVNKYFKKKKSIILDIGCGTGREALALTKLGHKVIGIDISEKEIIIAKNQAIEKKLETEYKLCNGLDLEFNDNYFDYSIIWAQTIGNVYKKKDRMKLLLENKRVLKQNGILCFSVHDYHFVKSNYKKCTKRERFYPYSDSECYWKLFTVEEIINEVKEVGLNILFCGKSKELDKNINIDVLICICKK